MKVIAVTLALLSASIMVDARIGTQDSIRRTSFNFVAAAIESGGILKPEDNDHSKKSGVIKPEDEDDSKKSAKGKDDEDEDESKKSAKSGSDDEVCAKEEDKADKKCSKECHDCIMNLKDSSASCDDCINTKNSGVSCDVANNCFTIACMSNECKGCASEMKAAIDCHLKNDHVKDCGGEICSAKAFATAFA